MVVLYGYVSELRYFARALGLGRIQSIVDSGPNLRMEGSDITKALPNIYLLVGIFLELMMDITLK